MSLSCAVLPDFNPGDDVLQFDLRLGDRGAGGGRCFCLRGHACDASWKSRRSASDVSSCADDASVASGANSSGVRNAWLLDRFYSYLLPPVTKWDAARFLTLSVDPWARYPPQDDAASGRGDAQACSSDDAVCAADETRFDKSEQAHAFFPLLPLVIRYATKCVVKCIPSVILPSTYEATTVLAGLAINMLAFVVAAVSLYDLTIFMLKIDELENSSSAEENGTGEISSVKIQNEESRLLLATATARLFCTNPAGVFFTAAYSESMFAMLTFAGHALVAGGQYHHYRLQKENVNMHEIRRIDWYWSKLYWIPTTILWMLASFTRSNGTFSAIWMILHCVASCCAIMQSSNRAGAVTSAVKCFLLLLFHGTLAFLISCPVLYHDWRGFSFHCLVSAQQKPEWCNIDTGRRFSLYAFVQRKHWNVGLFRYYELKQIPNFILALPVLVLSFAGGALWILHSWCRHSKQPMQGDATERRVFHGLCIVDTVKDVILWAFLAFGASSYGTDLSGSRKVCKREPLFGIPSSTKLLGPKFLSYYAILTGFGIIGAFLAHVQISTRLIFSSCPALYWLVSGLEIPSVAACKQPLAGGDKWGSLSPIILGSYFFLYNILGVIMHVNWLPWT